MESWRSRKTLILSRTDMMGLVTPAEYVSCVEQAYRMHGEGRYYMDPKGHIVLDKYPGEWEAMPSYIEEPEAAACKWVSIRERNREKFDLPTVFSILIYTHPETGFPLAICDGSYHTVMRTGAAAAVSAKWLARRNSKRLAIVGAGHMAEGTLATCETVFALDEVRVWSRSQPTLDEFVKTQGPKYPRFQIPHHEYRRGRARRRCCGDGHAGARAAGEGRVDRAGHAHGGARRRQGRRPGTRSAHPAARQNFCRRHPPMPDGRRDQCAVVEGPDPRGRTSPARSAKSSPARSRDAVPMTKSGRLIQPASRCRIRDSAA